MRQWCRKCNTDVGSETVRSQMRHYCHWVRKVQKRILGNNSVPMFRTFYYRKILGSIIHIKINKSCTNKGRRQNSTKVIFNVKSQVSARSHSMSDPRSDFTAHYVNCLHLSLIESVRMDDQLEQVNLLLHVLYRSMCIRSCYTP